MGYRFKRKFGIELEFLSQWSVDELAPAVAEALGGTYLKEDELDYFYLKGYCFPTKDGDWFLVACDAPHVGQNELWRGLKLVSPLLQDTHMLTDVLFCLESTECQVNDTCGLKLKWYGKDLGIKRLVHILSRTANYQLAMLKQFEVGVERQKYCKRLPLSIEKGLILSTQFDMWNTEDKLVNWFIQETLKDNFYRFFKAVSPTHPSGNYIVSLYNMIVDDTVSFNFFNATLDVDRIVQYVYFLEDMYLKEKLE